MYTADIHQGFETLLADLGQNAPKNDCEREIFRRVYCRGYEDGWNGAESVGVWTRLMRLVQW